MILAVDLGGTHCRFGIVDQNKVLHHVKVKTPLKRSEKSIFKFLCENLNLFIKEFKGIQKIVLGIPGLVSTREGVVYQSPHFPGWKKFRLVNELKKEFSLPILMDNDAHLIALGEAHNGVAREIDHFLYLGLGTGIGGAIVQNKKIQSGPFGFGGEFGHLNLFPLGRSCNCGGKGCLETYVSSSGILKTLSLEKKRSPQKVAKILKNDSSQIPYLLSQMALKKDPMAQRVFKEFGFHLGLGVSSLIQITGIPIVIIGGGLSQSYSLYESVFKKTVKESLYRESARLFNVYCSNAIDEMGLLGAQYL